MEGTILFLSLNDKLKNEMKKSMGRRKRGFILFFEFEY